VRLDGPPRDAEPVACPYLPDRQFVQRYFFGTDGTLDDAENILSAGWRRFGQFFFRPHCVDCQACRPVRVDASRIQLSASQKRIWRKNDDVRFEVVDLRPKDEYFELYAHHSLTRFGQEAHREDFERTFFLKSIPSFLTEYRVNGRLAGLGFCDEAHDGLSSVYFVFHEDFGSRSLGIYSLLREARLAVERGRRWYYLGYWVQGNATMAYKGRFFPRQILDWKTGQWSNQENDDEQTEPHL